MASKVNTRFVLILSAILVMLVGVVSLLLVYSNMKSATRNIARAEAHLADAEAFKQQGDEEAYYESIRLAVRQYGNAVNKETGDFELMETWVSTLERARPDTDAQYTQLMDSLRAALARISRLQPNSPESRLRHTAFEYEFFLRQISGPALDNPLKAFIDDTTSALTQLPEDDTNTLRIRGYRGLAQVQRMIFTRVEDEERELALEDLTVASEALPEWDALEHSIVLWHASSAQQYRLQGRTGLAQEAAQLSETELDRLLEADPDNVLLRASDFQRQIRTARRDLPAGEDPSQIATLANQLRSELGELILRTPAEKFNHNALQIIIAANALPVADEELLDRVFDHIRSGYPDSPEHIIFIGRVLASNGRFEQAIETLEPLSDPDLMPRPELSLDGAIFPRARMIALTTMADTALVAAERASAGSEARTEMLNRVVGTDTAPGIRAKIEERAGVEDQAGILLIDGRIAILQDQSAEASAKLNEARNELGDDPRILYYLGVANRNLGNNGVARDLLERVLESNVFERQPIRQYVASLEYAIVLSNMGEYLLAQTLLDRLKTNYGERDFIRQVETLNTTRYVAQLRSTRVRLEGEIRQLTDEVAAAPANSNEKRRLASLLRNAETQLAAATQQLDQLGADPTADAIEQAQLMLSRGEIDEATALIARTVAENPDDARPLVMQIQLASRVGDRDRAVQLSQLGAEKYPDVSTFQRYLERLTTDDPLAFAIAQIEENDSLTEAQRALALSQAYRAAGDLEKADEFLAEAVRIDETDHMVLENQFGNALANGETEEAQRLADLAASVNSDNVDGLTYTARIAMVNGDYDEAIEQFSEAADRLPTDPSIARFLARTYRLSGQTELAMTALRAAHEGRPTDTIIAYEYASLLQDRGEIDAALEIVGPNGPVASQLSTDQRLRELYLTLIAAQGNPARAIDSRLESLSRNPADGANTIALLQLLINNSRYEQAREVMDTVRASEESMRGMSQRHPSGSAELLLALVEAEMLIRTTGVEPAVSIVLETLDQVSAESDSVNPALSAGTFLLGSQFGGYELQAVELLRENRSKQDPSLLQIDQRIADQSLVLATRLSNRANQQQANQNQSAADQTLQDRERILTYAAESIQALVDSDSITDNNRTRFSIRLAQIKNEQGEESAAQSLIEEVLVNDPQSLDALLTAAEMALDRGDRDASRAYLDTAAAAHQDSHRPFISRAILNSSEQRLLPDVLQDLDIVHRLAPRLAIAWQLRFQLASSTEEIDEAVRRVRAAIQASPAAAGQLAEILVAQLSTVGRVEEAAGAAEEQANADVSSARWQAIAASLALQTQRYAKAVTFHQRLLGIAENRGLQRERGQAALGMLNAQIRGELSVPSAEVERLIREVDETIEEPSVTAMLVLARALIDTGNRTDGLRRIANAYEQSKDSSTSLSAFIADLDFALGSAEEADRYISFLEMQAGETPIMVSLASINNKAGKGLLNNQTLSEAESLLSNARAQDDSFAAFQVLRTLSRMAYGLEAYEEAERYSRESLDINPNALDAINDLAFVLAKHLDRVEDAVPLADQALAANPTDPNVLDTIGFVFLESGRIQDAIRTLNRAVAAAQTDTDRVPANVHLAQAYFADGNTSSASNHLERARRALENASPIIRTTYQQDIAELESALQGAG